MQRDESLSTSYDSELKYYRTVTKATCSSFKKPRKFLDILLGFHDTKRIRILYQVCLIPEALVFQCCILMNI